jgi:arylsulfatase A-like enzyme/tetratricopeptide (TPR) repeat protein
LRPSRRFRLSAVLLLALIGLTAAACRRSPPPPIVLVSIDTLRSDRLPLYGYGRGLTPAIDRLAKDGVTFERAFAQVPLTLPSHASLLTGLLPTVHGARDNVGFSLEPGIGRTIGERLRLAGYATGGAVSTFVLRAESGVARGFERFDAPVETERPAGATLAKLLPWLEEWRERRFLLFFHLYEPHMPHRAPPEIAARVADPYDAEVAAADAAVGELLAALDRLGLYRRSLIVLLSDHGEGLGDHGEVEHGVLLYREAIQVPLVVKLPESKRAGERVRRAVGLVDVLPTLLAAARLETDPSLPGLDLLTEPETPVPVYAETWYPFVHFGWSELVAGIDGRFHYIDGPKPELFDLDADPGERTNLLDRERRTVASMREFLSAFPRELAPPKQESDPETLAKLGALGYLSGAATAPTAGPKANPVDALPRIAPILAGARAVDEGRFEEAVNLLRPVLGRDPASMLGWQALGRALRALGREKEAEEAFAKTFGAADREGFMIVASALRLIDLGRSAEALDLARRELARSPRSADLRVVESRALMVLGRGEEALAAADAAVAADPRHADAHYQRAVVALAFGSAERADADLRSALELEPKHLQATKALAVLRFRLGDRAEAKRLLERALELSPGDPDATEGLALLSRGAA